MPDPTRTAIVTGASQGFGLALAVALSARGWTVVVDARHEADLRRATSGLPGVVAVPGDVTDPEHRRALVGAARESGGVDLLVNNASSLGRLGPLSGASAAELLAVYAADVHAPVALTQLALPLLQRAGEPAVVMLSSDAAADRYPGWGGYGSAKAALDHVAGTLAVENPWLRLRVRPGGHADGDAAGGVPGRGHLRPAGAIGRRPGSAATDRRARGQRALSLVRLSGGGRMSGLMLAVPRELFASEPAEARGLARDEVRLMVAAVGAEPAHTTFRELAWHLDPGDIVVVNISATVAAAVDGTRSDGADVTVHFSTPLPGGEWVVELRNPARVGDARVGLHIALPDSATLTLAGAYPDPHRTEGSRLWRARMDTPDVMAYLWRVGRPISYDYVPGRWPLTDYETVFARVPGSAEMPSAGRPFTERVLGELAARGIGVAPVVLHTGVSSLEAGETPLPERFRVPAATARRVNRVRRAGGRVVAVGTTVTRALESAADRHGIMRPARGWTELVLGPDRPAAVVDGLITGWHEPEASHWQLLEAVAGTELVGAAYEAALSARYLWHEFGDSCLLLPERRRAQPMRLRRSAS
jgi:S-adenosylmethionine:tRNA ribosyltransferase-isomerase